MSKYQLLDNGVRAIVKFFRGKTTIVGKQFSNTESFFYYNQSEHLTFLLKSSISYESIIQNKISKYIKAGDTVFDIGANIGQYAVLFSNLIGKTGKVVSYEPDNDNFAYLSFNKYKNNLTNLILENKGLGSKNGILKLYIDNVTGGRMNSMREDLSTGKSFIEVEIDTLKDVIEKNGNPNFIKMDVEGFESEVISGCDEMMLRNINATWLIEVRQDTKAYIYHSFLKANYNCFVIDNLEDVIITNEAQIPAFANLLLVPNKL